MTTRVTGLAVAVLLLAGPAVAQEAELGGQLRPRFEIRDPVAGAGTVEFTSMRTRASLGAALAGGVTAFVQLQDVRVFGEEASTLTDYSADGLDLHQGWIELTDTDEDRWSARVGRQETALGGHRLVGTVNWTQQARAFDGARLRVRPSDEVVVDGLAFRIADADGRRAVGSPEADYSLYGLYSTFEAAGALDVYALLDTRHAVVNTQRYTLGARWVSERDALHWRVESAYQLGSRENVALGSDISAFMVGARVGTQVADDLTATLWYDYLSGDDDPVDATDRVFDTLFATNHKFYGFMDLFLNIPVHTNRRGLQDLALKGGYDLGDGRTLGADLHSFHLTATDGLDTGHIGEELDLTYRWGYAPGVAVTSGVSYFLPADAWSTALGNPDENQLWGYVMLDVTF